MNPWRMFKRAVRRVLKGVPARELPRGRDPIAEIRHAFPFLQMNVVFDVGANVGQSATQYVANWPNARIRCFEPVPSLFDQLSRRFAGHPRVECHGVAMGSRVGGGSMVLTDNGTMAHLATANEALTATKTVTVEVTTLDEFCAAHGVDHLNYLKIDTEGADLEVLKGAQGLLSRESVDFVEAEVGMNPENTLQVPFGQVSAFLESRGYRLFGIYEQVAEWPTQAPNLRRTNPVFVSRRMLATAAEKKGRR